MEEDFETASHKWLRENFTFKQFAQDPDKWKVPKDNIFRQIYDNNQTRRDVREYRFRVKTKSGNEYKCDSLEKVDWILGCEGFKPNQVKCIPELRQDHTTGYYLDVLFVCPR